MSAERIASLLPPEVVRRSHWQDPHETRVANWIQPWDFEEPLDVGLLMIPIARGAIKHVATHLGPNAVRNVWPFFTTYSVDYDVDITPLRVRDLGDVAISLLDVPQAHVAIESVAGQLLTLNRTFFPIVVGGEHSLLAPYVRAFKKARGYARLGMIQFDAHMDVQTDEHGPHNGTPVRALIEDGTVDPAHLVQIGISGFVQARWHADWARERGVTVLSARDVATRGIAAVLEQAVGIAGGATEGIYVTFDIDCMDQAFAPGTGASLPGGLTPWQAYESLYQLGRNAHVAGLDVVEVDPSRDVLDITARLATKLVLTFLAGYAGRLER
jgi:formiminoglutamase